MRPSTGTSGAYPSPPPPSTTWSSPSGLRADLTGPPVDGVDRHGTAFLDLNPGRDELCLTVVVTGIALGLSAHLHAGSMDAEGPILMGFTEPMVGASATCARIPGDLIKKIQREPEAYYVEVHSNELPAGPLRGQLTEAERATSGGVATRRP